MRNATGVSILIAILSLLVVGHASDSPHATTTHGQPRTEHRVVRLLANYDFVGVGTVDWIMEDGASIRTREGWSSDSQSITDYERVLLHIEPDLRTQHNMGSSATVYWEEGRRPQWIQPGVRAIWFIKWGDPFNMHEVLSATEHRFVIEVVDRMKERGLLGRQDDRQAMLDLQIELIHELNEREKVRAAEDG